LKLKTISRKIRINLESSKKLFKILSAASLSTLIKSITSFIIGKLGAIWLGPAGIALMGQLGNVVTILNTVGAGLLESGTTALIAKNKDDQGQLIKICSNVLKISFTISAFLGILVIIFADELNKLAFQGHNYDKYIILCGIFIFISASSNLISSIINGLQQFKQLILINIITNVMVFFVTLILMYFYRLDGAFFSIIVAQPICFYLAYLLFKTRIQLKPIIVNINSKEFDSNERKSVLKYILMGFFSTIVMPATSFIVRSIIISNKGVDIAGYWESIVKVGYIYSSFILMYISYYFFPQIASIDDYRDIKKHIRLFMTSILPLFVLGCIPIYFFRKEVTLFVFTEQFSPINDLYLVQLAGEVIKVISGLYVMVLWVKNNLFDFIITQLVYSLSYIGVTYYLVNSYGEKAGTIAFFTSSFIYLMLLIILLEVSHRKYKINKI